MSCSLETVLSWFIFISLVNELLGPLVRPRFRRVDAESEGRGCPGHLFPLFR